MPQRYPRNTVRVLSFIILALACFLPYWNSLGNDFVYDDHYVVESNAVVRSLSVVDIFTSPFWQGFASETGGTYYRPLTVLTYALDYAVSGATARQFHKTNLLLHTLSTLLVFLLTGRLIRSNRAALLAAVLFAVHPVHTEAVSNVAGRSDILVGLFFVLTLLVFLSRNHSLRPLYGIPLMLAICSKEIGVAIPAILIACDVVWPRSHRQTPAGKRWGARVAEHAPSLVVVISFMLLRWNAIGSLATVVPSPLDNPLVEHGFLASCFTLPAILSHYVRLLVFPISLSVDYGYNQIPVATGPGLGFLALLGIAGAAFTFRSKLKSISPTVVAGTLILGLPLLLTANPFMATGSILSERYLYLPSIGFVLIIAAVAHRYRPSALDYSRQKLGWILIGLVAVTGGLRTADRNLDWKNDEALFASAVRETPNSVRANLNYAEVLSGRGDYVSASRHYLRVLQLKSDYPIVNLKLARTLQRSGQPNKALHYYRTTTQLSPGLAEAWRGLGSLSLNLGDDKAAEEAYRSALRLTPRNASLHNQLGVIYQKRGDNVKAVAAYERAIEGDYRHPGVFCNLGVIYQKSGNIDQARRAFNAALEIAPEMALVHLHIGSLEQESGNAEQAILHYEKFLAKWKPQVAGVTRDPGIANQVRQNLTYLRLTSRASQSLSAVPRPLARDSGG
jgi:tetratricopeptide (TPR) repeat protein